MTRPRKRCWAVCYDIADARRGNRVLRFMKGRGIHWQKSVFLLSADESDIDRLITELAAVVKIPDDEVCCYPISQSKGRHTTTRQTAASGIYLLGLEDATMAALLST